MSDDDKLNKKKDVEMEESSSGDETSSGDDEDQIMDDNQPANIETLNFDFEALPPDSEDLNQIANLLTQIFLRTDINVEGLSQAIIDQTPIGCVFKPTEDYGDEDDEDATYGVSSVVPLTFEQNFGIGELLIQRAKKYADKNVTQALEQLFSKNSKSTFGLFVNERMLHFPAKIAGPTLTALKNDIKSKQSLKKIETFIVILKLRFSEDETKKSGSLSKNAGKPKGKASKKRALANKLAEAEAVYDNDEERLLFEGTDGDVPHFQYPVHFDVEKKSKFHIVKRNGVVYQPYRRVCLLSQAQLFDFCDRVGAAFS